MTRGSWGTLLAGSKTTLPVKATPYGCNRADKSAFIVGPTSKADLSALLQPYGVAFTGNVVFDLAKSVPQDPRVIVVDGYGTHAITTDLRDLTFFPFTTNIAYPSSAPAGMAVVAFASSSDSSSADPNPQQPQKQTSDATG